MLLSIIVPVHNVEKYLDECLHSLVHQTYQNIEIIIIENDSTDNSPSIALQWQKKYPELIQYFSQKGGAAGGARNTGIQKAQGEYITFVDSDDYLTLNACQIFINKALETHADIIAGARIRYIEKAYHDPIISNYKKNTSFQLRIMAAHTKAYKLSYLKEHNITFPENCIGEDIIFYFETLFFANRVEWIDFPVYFYRIQMESVSQNFTHKYKKLLPIFIDCIKTMRTYFYDSHYQNFVNRHHMNKNKWMIFLLKKIYITSYGIIYDTQTMSRKEKKRAHRYLIKGIKKNLSFYERYIFFMIKIIYHPLLYFYHCYKKVN